MLSGKDSEFGVACYGSFEVSALSKSAMTSIQCNGHISTSRNLIEVSPVALKNRLKMVHDSHWNDSLFPSEVRETASQSEGLGS